MVRGALEQTGNMCRTKGERLYYANTLGGKVMTSTMKAGYLFLKEGTPWGGRPVCIVWVTHTIFSCLYSMGNPHNFFAIFSEIV